MKGLGEKTQKKRVLIIEDDPLHRKLLIDEFENLDLRLDIASNSDMALTYLRHGEPSTYDVVIVDLRIPKSLGEMPSVEEGFRILQNLDADKTASQIVVVTSGNLIDGIRKKLRNIDVNRVFEKPFPPSEIAGYITEIFPDIKIEKGENEQNVYESQNMYGTGNRWAVLVGVDEYDDITHYGQLHVCVNDVRAIHNQLIDGGFEPDRIMQLPDADVSPLRSEILVTLKAVAIATEPDDLLVFYYSGHGDEFNGASYLVTQDGRRLVLNDTAISISRITQIMKESAARAKVLIIDACHSGADIGNKGPRTMSEEFIRQVFEEAEGIAIFASCQKNQLSYEWRSNNQSVFTHYLLKALAGEADRDKKGFVTVQDVNRYVTNGVKLWSSKHKVIQTPSLQYTVSGDIILVDYR